MSALKGVTARIISFIGQNMDNIDLKGLSSFLYERHMEIAGSVLKGQEIRKFGEDLGFCLDKIESYGTRMAEEPETWRNIRHFSRALVRKFL